jgi:hypothetical protein
LDISSFEQPLNVYIISGNKVIKNITNHHLFIGYSPLVFAFPAFDEIDLSKTEKLKIVFLVSQITTNDPVVQKDAIATIYVRKFKEQVIDGRSIYYYKGEKGEHKFISGLYQLILQFHNRLYNKKPGNVYLSDNLLKQVQIAYSIPRIVSLVTVGDGYLYNLFPTDLHGQIDTDYYIISLRIGGKAAQQVREGKKIIISEIDSEFYKTVYSLGKNHMQELGPKVSFPFSGRLSATLNLPLPQQTIHYRELEMIKYFDHGIHRFFLFKILNSRQAEKKLSFLAHIHNLYATWRHNKGLPGNYLLR